MTLIKEIEGELTDARKAREDERRDALALLLNARPRGGEGLQRGLSDDEALQVLQRERKKRVEAIDAFAAAGRRARRAGGVRAGVLEEFMPEPLTEEEPRGDRRRRRSRRSARRRSRPRPRDGHDAGLGARRRLRRQPARAREARSA